MTVVHDMPSTPWHAGCRYAIPIWPWPELQSRMPSREVTTPTLEHQALARWLVTTEMGADEGPLAGSAAAGRVFDKLSHRLAQLITPVGSEALLTRAVHLSRAEFPFLDGVPSAQNTRGLIDRLREIAATVEPSQADEAFLSVLGALVGLLIAFIGEDLTFRLLRDVWPGVPMSKLPQPDAR
jgi:hypothetical protein